MSKRSDFLLFDDIIENAQFVFDNTKNDTYNSFINDKMKLYAVIRAMEIIGEAAKVISEETKLKYCQIDWREMSDFRNLLIHHYFGVSYKILWSVIQNDLPHNYRLLKEIEL
ncbi:MAG: DUF86 domain-containing protein [Bacteroidota bacterium]|nr:DUF86 domain-containing protein [Bacteroidota bacterium]